jgi:hypothetical protein
MRGRDDTVLSWFLAGIATSLAGGIVYALTRSPAVAVLAGLVVLVVLLAAHASGGS